MLHFPCLVLDHDDTVVQSEQTINYPFFCQILEQYRPGQTISLAEYTAGCFHPGFAGMCRERFHFTQQELEDEFQAWLVYVRSHIPPAHPGIAEIIRRQKAEGGLICVVSHSSTENILRDYRTHFRLEPDAVYSWDLPEALRKPSPYALTDIMQRYSLRPEQLLVVDDMKPGYTMARQAGVPIAFAGWGRAEFPDIYAEMSALCTFVCPTPADLAALLF